MDSADNKNNQVEKFREAARKHETDDSEEAFDRVLKKTAKGTPPNHKPNKTTK